MKRMRIKKILSLFLVLILLFCLSGCSGNVYTQADQQYIVSAIGFLNKSGRIRAVAEAVAVNAESTEQSVERVVLEGEGATPAESVLDLAARLSKPLLFDHCGVILTDATLNREEVEKVLSYCEENKQINLAAYIVYSDDIEKLLSLKPMAALTVGYDIIGVIDRAQSLYGIKFFNRFYEVKANTLKKSNTFLLPSFEAVGEEYTISGSEVYSSFERKARLTNEQTALYCLITDTYSHGAFSEYKIASAKCFFDSSIKDEKLYIDLRIKAQIEKGSREKLLEELEQTANTLNLFFDSDIFAFSNRIYRKNQKVWKKIVSKEKEFIKNAHISIALEDI